MQQINYHTNEPMPHNRTIPLTTRDITIIRTRAYRRGLRAGILITIIITFTIGYIIYLTQ